MFAHCNISRAWHSTWQVKEGRKEGRPGGSGGWEKRRKESGKRVQEGEMEKVREREEGKK